LPSSSKQKPETSQYKNIAKISKKITFFVKFHFFFELFLILYKNARHQRGTLFYKKIIKK